jgi:hypothetical protein
MTTPLWLHLQNMEQLSYGSNLNNKKLTDIELYEYYNRRKQSVQEQYRTHY